MSAPNCITVEANELEEILVVDLSDSGDDTNEVEILGDTTNLGTDLFEDLIDKYEDSYMDEVMEV